jgi:hypothetical protein
MNDGTTSQYSKAFSAFHAGFSRFAGGIAARPELVRWGLGALGAIGAILLVASEFSTITHVKVITVVLKGTEVSGFDQNSGAMLIVGLAALPMLYGAVRVASRPAMAAAALLGLIALLIALIGDLPEVTKVGTVVRASYEEAKASPQAGFYFETLGAVLLLLSGGGMLLLTDDGDAQEKPADA